MSPIRYSNCLSHSVAIGLSLLTLSTAQAQWSTSGANVFRATGNVGIATNNPSCKLDVRSSGNRAILGWATANSGSTDGVYGRNDSTSGRAVYGYASATSGSNVGIYGKTNSPGGYAGYFIGNVGVNGWIGTKSDLPVELRSKNAAVMRMQYAQSGAFNSANIIGGHASNSVNDGVIGAVIAGGGRNDDPNSVTAEFGSIGGGFSNVAGEHAVVAGGHYNNATGHGAVIGGGNLNNAIATGTTISGGYENYAGDTQATVGGGLLNSADAKWSTVGGGEDNHATGVYSTISGGASNFATDNDCSVGGGTGNTAGNGGATTTDSTHATIAGGSDNNATAFAAAIGGGKFNNADAWYSTVPGGFQNTAGGTFSFAAGRRAQALHEGSFVWSDSTDADVTTDSDNQFLARASGGVQFFDSAGVGVQLAPGGNSWSALSDRNLKTNITLLNPKDVLMKLQQVPITRWNLVSQDQSIHHVGPMAQDFHAAFGLGESNRMISQTDADGIALAAIQGLHQLLQEKDAEIAAIRSQHIAENTELRERLKVLEQLVLRTSPAK